MKVLTVTDFAHVEGGASRVAIETTRWLADAGHAVEVFAGRGPVDAALDGVRVHALGHPELASMSWSDPRGPVRGIWSATAAGRLGEVVDGLGSDAVVHVHSWTKVLSSSVFRALRSRRVPVVLTAHDYFTVCQNGGLYSYPTGRPCGVRPGTPRCYLTDCDSRSYAVKWYRNARQLAQRWAADIGRSADAVVYPSEAAARRIRPHLSVPVQRVIAAPSGSRSGQVTQPWTSDRIVGVGRLSAEKEVVDLAQAARRLPSRWRVAIIGDGAERHAIASADPRIELPGWLSTAEVDDRIAGARVVVFPSRWFETYGLVVEEALARGVPCIVADVTAAAERHRDHAGCWIYRAGDVDSLADCLHAATDDAEVRRRALVARAASAVATRERYLAELLDVYGAALDAHR